MSHFVNFSLKFVEKFRRWENVNELRYIIFFVLFFSMLFFKVNSLICSSVCKVFIIFLLLKILNIKYSSTLKKILDQKGVALTGEIILKDLFFLIQYFLNLYIFKVLIGFYKGISGAQALRYSPAFYGEFIDHSWVNYFVDKEFYTFFSYEFCNLNLMNGLNYKLSLSLGYDGLSLLFLFLTSLLFFICLNLSFDNLNNLSVSYFFFLMVLELFVCLSFLSLDIFFFYIFFEIVVIPMFFLIFIWGSRSRKILAAFLFFIYTALGSIFILIVIILMIGEFGTTDIRCLWCMEIPFKKQCIIWLFLFFGFSIKVPMFPFHSWLPEAHVEAPTVGSIILAGLLLKLGGYGFIRFLLPLCNKVNYLFTPLVYCLSLVSIIFCSFIIIRQVDIKKIIAYSSIIHMNVSILGIFSFTYEGLAGSLMLMFGHGLISGGFFLLIGVLYERYGTRLIYYYGGIVRRMPLFVLFFFFFTLSNVSFPGTINFIGEFLTFLGVLNFSQFSVLIGAFFVMFFGAFYSFWLFNRVAFGELKEFGIGYFYDLTFSEFFSLLLLSLLILFFGVNSFKIFLCLDESILFLLSRVL